MYLRNTGRRDNGLIISLKAVKQQPKLQDTENLAHDLTCSIPFRTAFAKGH